MLILIGSGLSVCGCLWDCKIVVVVVGVQICEILTIVWNHSCCHRSRSSICRITDLVLWLLLLLLWVMITNTSWCSWLLALALVMPRGCRCSQALSILSLRHLLPVSHVAATILILTILHTVELLLPTIIMVVVLVSLSEVTIALKMTISKLLLLRMIMALLQVIRLVLVRVHANLLLLLILLLL